MQTELTLQTHGRSTLDTTNEFAEFIDRSKIQIGTCLLFLQHTSASLLITESADPTVRRDLEAWLARAVPDGDPLFQHTAEGPDDMPAHVRAALLATSLTLPIQRGRLALGTWQGVFLFEHRTAAHQRRVLITLTKVPA